MARHRTRVRLARSLRAIALGALASALATALFEWDLGRSLELPLALIATAPPVVYLAIAVLVMRHAPAGRWLNWALAACGVNAAIGLGTSMAMAVAHPLSFEGALMRAFGLYVPAPMIHLAAAPLVLLAFRSRVAPLRMPARGRAGGMSIRPPGSPFPGAGPNYDDVLRPTPQSGWPVGSGAAALERARRRAADVAPAPTPVASERSVGPAAAAGPAPSAPPPLPVTPSRAVPSPAVGLPASGGPAVVARATVAAAPTPAAPVRWSGEGSADVPDEPMLRFPFERLAGQLPPDVFVLPPGRLGESLREPHTLLVPQRLVVPQLGEGRVEVAWTLIEDQFPELALAMPRGEVRRRFPDWVLSLPLDEVVRQVPRELFRVAAPAPDLSEIGEFPAPFSPELPAPGPERAAETAPAVTLPGTAPAVMPATVAPPVVTAPAVVPPVATAPVTPSPIAPPVVTAPVTPSPVAPPVVTAPVMPSSVAPPVATPPVAAPPVVTPPAAAPSLSAPALAPPPVVTPSLAAPLVLTAAVSAPPAATPAEVVEPVMAAPRPVPVVPAPVSASPSPSATPAGTAPDAGDEQLTSLARALAISLAPIGALEWRAERIDSRPVVSLVAAALAREAVDEVAARGVALLERLAPWSVDQITVRTSRVACVVTPLTAGGAFAAAVRRGGMVALLELLAGRVRGAGRSGSTTTAAPAVPGATPVDQPHGRIGEAARALAVLGPAVSTEIAGDGAAPGVFLFARRADAGLVAAARAVHEVLVAGHDDSVLGRLESVTLRRGRERLIVRPLRGRAGRPAVLAAAGDTTLTGRVQRSAARASTLLEAH